MRLYVAYGSNLNVEQMRYRCPDARIFGTSFIDDYELLFKGSKTGSYLTIEKRIGSKVPVAVWEVSEKDELNLDRYEGYPAFYYKKEMVLPVLNSKTGKVKRRKVFVYIMHEFRTLGLPTTWYVDTCVQGYNYFGFNRKYLVRAIKRSAGREAV